MNKNAGKGLLALLLWASLLTLTAFLFFEDGPDSPKALLRGLSYAVPLLFAGFYILVFLALKGRRLRLLGFLAAGLALSFSLDRLDLSRGPYILAVLGIAVLYLLACSLLNFRRLQKALQPLSEAALAYQKDHDGEKCLAALDRCAALNPRVSDFKRPDTGTVTYQQHILCEKIQVLGDMGRLEERRELIDRLRREAKRPELLRWLDEKEAAFSIGAHPEP